MCLNADEEKSYFMNRRPNESYTETQYIIIASTDENGKYYTSENERATSTTTTAMGENISNVRIR